MVWCNFIGGRGWYRRLVPEKNSKEKKNIDGEGRFFKEKMAYQSLYENTARALPLPLRVSFPGLQRKRRKGAPHTITSS